MDIHTFDKVLREFLKKPVKIGTVLLFLAIFSVVGSYSSGFFSELGKNHLEKIGNNNTIIKRKLVQGDEWSKIVKCDHMSESFSVKFEKFLSKKLVRILLHSPEMGRFTEIRFDAESGFDHSFSSGNEIYSFQLNEVNVPKKYVTFTLEIEEQGN